VKGWCYGNRVDGKGSNTMPHLTDTRDGNYDKFRFVEFDKNGKGSFSCGPYSEGDRWKTLLSHSSIPMVKIDWNNIAKYKIFITFYLHFREKCVSL